MNLIPSILADATGDWIGGLFSILIVFIVVFGAILNSLSKKSRKRLGVIVREWQTTPPKSLEEARRAILSALPLPQNRPVRENIRGTRAKPAAKVVIQPPPLPEETQKKASAPTAVIQPVAPISSRAAAPRLTASTLREQFILTEILRPPLSLRDPAES